MNENYASHVKLGDLNVEVLRIRLAGYSKRFSDFVLQCFESDQLKGRKWASAMLAPQVMADIGHPGRCEVDEPVPYEVCVIEFADGALVGFVINVALNLGQALNAQDSRDLRDFLLRDDASPEHVLMFPESS